MPIKGNNSALKDIAITDTTALNAIDGRASVTFATVKNNGATNILVEAWKSPTFESTNSAAERIYSKTLAVNEEDTPAALLTTVPITWFLVFKAAAVGTIIDLSYTQYSGDD